MGSDQSDLSTKWGAARVLLACLVTCSQAFSSPTEQADPAVTRADDLLLAVYATSRQVEQLATDPAARTRAHNAIRRLGISKVYVEVYRGGHRVSESQLVCVRDWLQTQNLLAVGGIATVPGDDFGVRQEGPLDWFNWQNPKTQHDMREVVMMAARVFDQVIVDDFFCTGDVSEESTAARGERSWSDYRCELLSQMAREVCVEPARTVNPSVTMIIKYPQWYDRFHLFGYDTVTLPKIFDRVWVGTETRGRTTQRFGFVQPYQGFVNYRWLADIAAERIGGAWFDHGDCGEFDFLDQAYMSVLAGARELVFFNLDDVTVGHPDHVKLVAQFDLLADLAQALRDQPTAGVPAYKPPNSDPAGDMYIMDFLGMLGIPLVPVHQFPRQAKVIFLPAQAAADPQLLTHVHEALQRGARLVVTTSLLCAEPHAGPLRSLLGLTHDLQSQPFRAEITSPSPSGKQRRATGTHVDLESPLALAPGSSDVVCTSHGQQHLLLFRPPAPARDVAILNVHTFSQADFDAVGEVLLCPRPLGLLELQGQPLQALRAAFHEDGTPEIEGHSGVTVHWLPDRNGWSYVLQNFQEQPAEMTLRIALNAAHPPEFRDLVTHEIVPSTNEILKGYTPFKVTLPARGRAWLRLEP